MSHKHAVIAAASLLPALVLALSPAPARASDEPLPYAAEVESCIAMVDRHLELDGARRVRHLVSDADRTGIGYALRIETTVLFGDGAGVIEKRYESYCVARGANDPSTFRIEEIEA